MSKPKRWQRRLCVVLLAVLCLAAGQGCLSFVHWLDVPPKEQVAQSETIPAPCRNHVHIFLLHGLDPLDLANLSGLTTYIQQLGYSKTYYGQVYHLWEFKNTMRRIHKQEPQARFVLIGFSLGAIMARELANADKADGIGIDLLVYLGGFTLANSPRTQPENVARLASILTEGCIRDARIDRADNIRYSDVWHFGTPTHSRTRELLSRELAAAARKIDAGAGSAIVCAAAQRMELPQLAQRRRRAAAAAAGETAKRSQSPADTIRRRSVSGSIQKSLTQRRKDAKENKKEQKAQTFFLLSFFASLREALFVSGSEGNHSCTTGLRSTPSFSISTSTASPLLRKTCGLRVKPTPDGVPVKIKSPTSSVTTCEA
jgi:pimeloyl-ACP methyl ester carboxylesterase